MSLAEDLDERALVPVVSPVRHPRVRGRTVSIKRLGVREIERGRVLANMLLSGLDATRPKTRAECIQGPNADRPCPFVSCKYHLYLDVSPRSGAIKVNFPNLELHEMRETCALDVVDRGESTLEEVGGLMNLTRERIRQLETRGLEKLKTLDAVARAAELAGLGEAHPHLPAPEETKDRASLAEDVATFTHLGPLETAWWQSTPGGDL